jgi:hypothetical protein
MFKDHHCLWLLCYCLKNIRHMTCATMCKQTSC